MDTFKAARPSILKFGQALLEAQRNGNVEAQKRKFDEADFGDSNQRIAVRRKTRSQSQQSPQENWQQRVNQVPNLELANMNPDVDLQKGMPRR